MKTDPTDVARHDYLEFFVERVISMTVNPKKLNSLSFMIKWVGYDVTHNSEEPWSNLRDLAILHTYLTENGLRNIIPMKFKTDIL
jgi:hypothetical protein